MHSCSHNFMCVSCMLEMKIDFSNMTYTKAKHSLVGVGKQLSTGMTFTNEYCD